MPRYVHVSTWPHLCMWNESSLRNSRQVSVVYLELNACTTFVFYLHWYWSSLSFSQNTTIACLKKFFFKCIWCGCTRMRQMMEGIVKENPPSTGIGVDEHSVTTVSVGSLWDCYEMSYTFTVCEWFFCVQPLCGMYENIVNCDWLALLPSLIGSWCHSRKWSVVESERLLCTEKLLIW